MFLLICGLLLASEPTLNASLVPGWITLNHVVPPAFSEEQAGRFWIAIGSMIVFLSSKRLGKLRWLLCTAPAQYLGTISFSLYLIHNAVMSSVGAFFLERLVYGPGWDMETAIAASLAVVFVLSVWLADIFHRMIDQPVALAMKLVEERVASPREWSY